MPEIVTLTEITENRGVFIRELNKSMMVAFINRHGRYDLDVRTSYCYYDADGDFILALANKIDGPGADQIIAKLGLRYWSKGIQ